MQVINISDISSCCSTLCLNALRYIDRLSLMVTFGCGLYEIRILSLISLDLDLVRSWLLLVTNLTLRLLEFLISFTSCRLNLPIWYLFWISQRVEVISIRILRRIAIQTFPTCCLLQTTSYLVTPWHRLRYGDSIITIILILWNNLSMILTSTRCVMWCRIMINFWLLH